MAHPNPRLTIHTSTLFDPRQKKFISDVSITVDTGTGLITSIIARDDVAFPLPDPLPEDTVDLRGKFVMPGFVDAHTHIFACSSDETSLSGSLKRGENMTERVIGAVNHARKALLAGYTTYRDLGSEGMREADRDLRDAIDKGLVPGPRLFVATRPLACADSLEPQLNNSSDSRRGSRSNGEISGLPFGAEGVNGVEEIRHAVRKRVIASADIISVYADYPRRVRAPASLKQQQQQQQHPYTAGVLCLLKGLNPDFVVFSQEEMDMMVSEARLARRPVAARCESLEGAMGAIKAGVRAIEGAYGVTEGILRAMAEKSVVLCPMLASAEALQPQRLPALFKQTRRAYDLGVRIACGGDMGAMRHGDNVREMELMVECGIPVEDVLESCMVAGWESCGGDLCGRRFGWFEEGTQADIVALEIDPRVDIGALRNVDFVMKDAKIWKLNGSAVGMF
ncbi:hypothetical protein DL95DRAFT_444320 [Leptodontidium sp. 2 PMI_412]|nr:hypothetical protein DL95DRAFT_444320 [Leptodontidium sp. 2 PMI_412]